MRFTFAALTVALVLAVSASATTPPRRVYPSFGWSFGPTRVTVTVPPHALPNAVECTGTAPCPVQLFFDDVEAQVVRVRGSAISAIVPPQSPRSHVDVRVAYRGVTVLVLPDVFGWSTTGLLDRENYTAVLLPLLSGIEVRGANGSVWTTELTVFNAAPVDLWLQSVGGSVSYRPSHVPPHDGVIPAGKARRLNTWRGSPARGDGIFLYVPSPLVGSTHFSLRVRDGAGANGWGTTIPLLTAEDFRSKVTLLDVPTEPRYRATLRIYHWSERGDLPARVTIYSQMESVPLASIDVASSGVAAENHWMGAPAYAELDLLSPALREHRGMLRVEVDNVSGDGTESRPPVWAFVSVTDSETNRVTVLLPKTNR